MKILALDTATEACSAAIYNDGEVTQRYQVAPREHSRLLLKMMDDLLNDSDFSLSQMDAIAFGRGPGSFMGLRIAAGITQGIAFAHDLPVIPVSNLKAIAEVAYLTTGCSNVLSAIDARMAEVYWGGFQRDDKANWSECIDECVVAPDKVTSPAIQDKTIQWTGAGTGWGCYEDVLRQSSSVKVVDALTEILPSAEAIARIASYEYEKGNTANVIDAQPIYLRNDVAKKPKLKTYAEHLNL